MIVGSGGREDAIVRNLVSYGHSVYSCIGIANPSIIRNSAEYVEVQETDWKSIHARSLAWRPDLAVVSPDSALDTPLVDSLTLSGIPVASPSSKAAEIETSKQFMRSIMAKYSIEGNLWNQTYTDSESLRSGISGMRNEFVVKPIGLTGGKGVRVMGEHFPDAESGIKLAEEILGKDGRVLIEEKVTGEEFSLQVFCDGTDIVAMPLAQDYKRAYEGNTGPNTGGMGSITDSDHLLPFVSAAQKDKAMGILRRIVSALSMEGRPFTGIMYGQFMASRNGVKVIEINARFADPEGINVINLLDEDLGEIFMKLVNGNVETGIRFKNRATVLKYVVPPGYGSNPRQTDLIISPAEKADSAELYYASVTGTLDKVKTSKSRALAIIAQADSIPEASRKVDESLKRISGEFAIRRDIGSAEMIRRKVASLNNPAS